MTEDECREFVKKWSHKPEVTYRDEELISKVRCDPYIYHASGQLQQNTQNVRCDICNKVPPWIVQTGGDKPPAPAHRSFYICDPCVQERLRSIFENELALACGDNPKYAESA